MAGIRLAGLVDSPENAPPNDIGVAPFVPKHIVVGKLACVAVGVSAKWNRFKTGADTGGACTSIRTVFDGCDRRSFATSHSASAVFEIIFGVVAPLCACAVMLMADSVAPAVSIAANWIIDLVNDFISKKSGVLEKPSGKYRKRRFFLVFSRW